jgi:hypothetical protein
MLGWIKSFSTEKVIKRFKVMMYASILKENDHIVL